MKAYLSTGPNCLELVVHQSGGQVVVIHVKSRDENWERSILCTKCQRPHTVRREKLTAHLRECLDCGEDFDVPLVHQHEINSHTTLVEVA